MKQEKLNKKLAELAGFKDIVFTEFNIEAITPDGWAVMLPFTVSLDVCSKWLVPERISEITFKYASNCVSCEIEDLEGNFFEGHCYTESIEESWRISALTLCLAIEKLIAGLVVKPIDK